MFIKITVYLNFELESKLSEYVAIERVQERLMFF